MDSLCKVFFLTPVTCFLSLLVHDIHSVHSGFCFHFVAFYLSSLVHDIHSVHSGLSFHFVACYLSSLVHDIHSVHSGFSFHFVAYYLLSLVHDIHSVHSGFSFYFVAFYWSLRVHDIHSVHSGFSFHFVAIYWSLRVHDIHSLSVLWPTGQGVRQATSQVLWCPLLLHEPQLWGDEAECDWVPAVRRPRLWPKEGGTGPWDPGNVGPVSLWFGVRFSELSKVLAFRVTVGCKQLPEHIWSVQTPSSSLVDWKWSRSICAAHTSID